MCAELHDGIIFMAIINIIHQTGRVGQTHAWMDARDDELEDVDDMRRKIRRDE